MFKKYIQFYKESIQLAFSFPRFALFFLLVNLPILLQSFPITGNWEMVYFTVNLMVKMAALGGIGYVALKIVRTGKAPRKIFSCGVKNYFWLMLKFMILQLFLTTLAWFLPISLLERSFMITPLIRTFWYWFVEFVFIFFIYEGIFWEDKGLMAGYRMRNIYMLDRFEWVFPVYLMVKLPHILLELLPYWGWDWLLTPWGVGLIILVVSLLDWVNILFSFKVFGADRLQVAREMEKRIKEAEKQRTKKRKSKNSE